MGMRSYYITFNFIWPKVCSYWLTPKNQQFHSQRLKHSPIADMPHQPQFDERGHCKQSPTLHYSTPPHDQMKKICSMKASGYHLIGTVDITQLLLCSIQCVIIIQLTLMSNFTARQLYSQHTQNSLSDNRFEVLNSSKVGSTTNTSQTTLSGNRTNDSQLATRLRGTTIATPIVIRPF